MSATGQWPMTLTDLTDPRGMLLALVGDVNREAIVINAQAKLW